LSTSLSTLLVKQFSNLIEGQVAHGPLGRKVGQDLGVDRAASHKVDVGDGAVHPDAMRAVLGLPAVDGVERVGEVDDRLASTLKVET
jgi:hypothetical protein